MNSGALDEAALYRAERRVLGHQRKLHRWARNEPRKRFDDVFNLVCDQATMLVAWDRVSGNQGAKTAGVDAVTRRHVEEDIGVLPFLEDLRFSLKDGTFTALPVRPTTIPKPTVERLHGVPSSTQQIQALDRAQPVLPMMPGMPERRTHDHSRNGITSLFAAFDIADGTVIGELHRQHRAVEFKKFLITIDKAVPADLEAIWSAITTGHTRHLWSRRGWPGILGSSCISPRLDHRGLTRSSGGSGS